MSRLSTVTAHGWLMIRPLLWPKKRDMDFKPSGFLPFTIYEINWNGMKWMSMENLKAKMCFFSLCSRQFWWTYPEVWDYAALLFQVKLTALQKQSSTAGSFKKDRVKFSLEPSRDASLLVFLVILIDFVWSCFFGCTMKKDAASHHGDLIRQCLIKNSSSSGSRG